MSPTCMSIYFDVFWLNFFSVVYLHNYQQFNMISLRSLNIGFIGNINRANKILNHFRITKRLSPVLNSRKQSLKMWVEQKATFCSDVLNPDGFSSYTSWGLLPKKRNIKMENSQTFTLYNTSTCPDSHHILDRTCQELTIMRTSSSTVKCYRGRETLVYSAYLSTTTSLNVGLSHLLLPGSGQ